MKRRAGLMSTLALVAALSTACSDDSGDSSASDETTQSASQAASESPAGDDAAADDTASEEPTRSAEEQTFCAAMEDLYTALGTGEADGFVAARDAVQEVEAPASISGEAREGHALFMDRLDDLDPDDLSNTDTKVSNAEQKKLESFGNAYFTLCMDPTESDQFEEE